jgi:hypothetical protein
MRSSGCRIKDRNMTRPSSLVCGLSAGQETDPIVNEDSFEVEFTEAADIRPERTVDSIQPVHGKDIFFDHPQNWWKRRRMIVQAQFEN